MAGDDVMATVWARNGMGLESSTTSGRLRIDPDPPTPAAPLPVRDLPSNGLDTDIDYQSRLDYLKASWEGWSSTYSWIMRCAVLARWPERIGSAAFVDGGGARVYKNG